MGMYICWSCEQKKLQFIRDSLEYMRRMNEHIYVLYKGLQKKEVWVCHSLIVKPKICFQK